MSERDSALESIRSSISKHGYHVYLVAGGTIPRFAYTIGLSESAGCELIFGGGSFFTKKDVKAIIDAAASELKNLRSKDKWSLNIAPFGIFSLRAVDDSWSKQLMLGALDYYKTSNVHALQIAPGSEHQTADVPDMSQPWDADREPVWRWLHEKWQYPVPAHSNAVTNLGALRREKVTEAARWEEDQWELFAGNGPDIPESDIRVVPLGTLLAIDPSLDRVTKLEVGHALWRDESSLEWHNWESTT